MNNAPDLEVIFRFNGVRSSPIYSGYRPAHLITESYLSTGIHHYYNLECIPPDGSAAGTITFLTPEEYPASCWVGKEMSIQEGSRIVGYALITKILNPILRCGIANENMKPK